MSRATEVPRDDALPEADALPGAPHPRFAEQVFGHDAAEAALLDAIGSGRLHHAWLLTGPKGIGKASFAWRAARALLALPTEDPGPSLFGDPEPLAAPTSLDLDPDHPVARRVAALSEPRLFLLRRPYDAKLGRFKQDIPVDAARGLKGFFSMAAMDGGRRVVIVDAADEMNANAANALLKVLEEPPADTVMFLICHAPSKLLPTIRSRCRTLRMAALSPEDLGAALAQATGAPLPEAEIQSLLPLAEGSVGQALSLRDAGGPEAYESLLRLLGDLPRLDRQAMAALADSASARGAEGRLDLLLSLTEVFLHRLARTGATGAAPALASPAEAELLTRLAPHPRAGQAWATAHAELVPRVRAGRAVNLDASMLLLDMFHGLQSVASGPAAA
ncbi:DNA polymerase III subunit delta' [Dinoroseobacter sp. S124A]|uniref:DNA polymerase III subunit delta' n=1 Tax=Dinoroseobacter sp. S124A TaxID=3415128 RepID=UPI003C7D7A82